MSDARRFGFSDEAIAAIQAQLSSGREGDQDGIWPDNAATVEAFMAVATQWRFVAAGAPSRLMALGLDYAGARAGMEALGITITPALWAGVLTMEEEARGALNGIAG